MIGLFMFSISSWFTLGRLYPSKNWSISSRLSNLLAYGCSLQSLTILGISVGPVVTSPFSFLILLVWVLFLFYLMSLAKSLSILFIFSKNQLLVSLIFAIIFFESRNRWNRDKENSFIIFRNFQQLYLQTISFSPFFSAFWNFSCVSVRQFASRIPEALFSRSCFSVSFSLFHFGWFLLLYL